MAQSLHVLEAVDADMGRWDAYVQHAPGASAYHQAAWRRVLENNFGHRTFYLMAHRGDEIVGVLPLALVSSRLFGRYLVSLPFLTYGGICAEDEQVVEVLAQRAADVAEECRAAHVELRHVSRQLRLPTRETKSSLWLALPRDADSLWKALDAKVRNQVRKAQKSGLAAREEGSESVHAFHRIYTANMRDLGSPPHTRTFFRSVLDAFPGSSHVFLVWQGPLAVAGALALQFRDRLEVPWAASLRDARPLCPNNLLYWTMLSWACEKGCSVFDFGRSTVDSGTYRFKLQWGARPQPLHWQYLLREGQPMPALNPDNPRFRWAIECWKRLPLSVTTWLGPRLLRGLPG